jgi:hypothetical protein
MPINLKNYTTEVAASKSIEQIEKLLIQFGASNIMKECSSGGKCSAISFMIVVENMKLPFRLPAKVKEAYVWLKKKFPARKDATLLEQAERVVWKQLWDWTHITLSGIELEQLETLEALFPYLYDIAKGESYYDKVKANQFKALLPNG